MKLLINTPDYHNPSSGGVASFYNGMIGYWNENVLYNVVGRRKRVSGALWLPWDIVKFLTRLLIFRPDAVIVNPSLMRNALRRDFLFLELASALGYPVVIIIHGFNLDVAKSINHEWVCKELNKSSLILTLASSFKGIMQDWGVKTPIELISTKVEDRMLDGFNIDNKKGDVNQILFLSRVIREKGVYETLDTFMILKKTYPHLRLIIVGDGPELKRLKDYASKNKMVDIVFTGALSGDNRLNVYRESDIFFLASYGEGMPTVVLEAMAFGLPVITRKVGGLADFFEDGKMGRITDSLDPTEFAKMMIPFIEDKELTRKVAVYNHKYAVDNFMASKVGLRIEDLIKRHV